MGVYSGPEIVNNGLVFHYDMSNTEKSWKGKPTTNLISNPTEEMSRGEFGQYRDLAPIFDANGLVPYSLSMDIKVNKPGNVLVYMQNGSSSKYGFVSSQVSATTQYQRFYFNNLTPSLTGDGSTAATLATYTTYGSGVNPTVKNIQLELGTFATPFVNGTRSNTQAIIDVTKNNTITASSLTYNSDGSFSFASASDNYMYITPSSSLNAIKGSSAVTAEAWVYYTSYSGGTESYSVITLWGSPWVWLLENPSNTLRFRITAGGSDTNISDTTTHPLNTWIHVVGTYDGANKAIYINGSLRNSSAQTGTLGSPGGSPVIGTYQGTNYSMNGKIASVKIYNRALTATEIKQNFEAQRYRYGI